MGTILSIIFNVSDFKEKEGKKTTRYVPIERFEI